MLKTLIAVFFLVWGSIAGAAKPPIEEIVCTQHSAISPLDAAVLSEINRAPITPALRQYRAGRLRQHGCHSHLHAWHAQGVNSRGT